MANSNTQGFGLIPAGTLGSTPSTGGQGKYWIVAGYSASDLFQGTPVRIVNGYVTTAQAAITNTTVGVFNGIFYNAATTLKPTWVNWYNQPITPANSENIQCFVVDNPFQLFVAAADAAVPQADHFETYGMTVTAAGSEINGQSSATLTYGTRAPTANQWRLLRVSEDPSNEDITAAFASYVVVQNLNQVNSGGLTSAS